MNIESKYSTEIYKDYMKNLRLEVVALNASTWKAEAGRCLRSARAVHAIAAPVSISCLADRSSKYSGETLSFKEKTIQVSHSGKHM